VLHLSVLRYIIIIKSGFISVLKLEHWLLFRFLCCHLVAVTFVLLLQPSDWLGRCFFAPVNWLAGNSVPTGPEKWKKEKSGHEKSWIWTLVLKKCWFLVTVVLKNQFSQHVSCNALMKQLCKYTYNCKCCNLCFLCAPLHLGPKYCNYSYQICCSRP